MASDRGTGLPHETTDMPIKFHCQHCEQFLGIARSRAGAVVDCPQCGRSLRVPELDGRVRKMPPPTKEARGDSGLISALSQLSELGTLAEGGPPAESLRSPQINPERVSPERVDLQSVPLERIEDAPPREESSHPDEDGPFALSASLSELATFSDPVIDGTNTNDLLQEMREVSHPSASPLLISFGGALLILLGTAGGWWLGRSDHFNQPNDSADNGPDVKVIQNEGEAPEKASDLIRQSGAVTYQDSSGTTRPDDGALVLLLPVRHEGSFRLHAKAFTKPAGDIDRIATIAALSAIGGAAVVSDEAGRYELQTESLAEKVVVIVSRHQMRPADVAIPEDIGAFLNSWFDSTHHICGQLKIQMKQPQTPAAPLNFSF